MFIELMNKPFLVMYTKYETNTVNNKLKIIKY